MGKCINCNEDFEQKRSTKKFCGTKCKNGWHEYRRGKIQMHTYLSYSPSEKCYKLRGRPSKYDLCRFDINPQEAIEKFGEKWYGVEVSGYIERIAKHVMQSLGVTSVQPPAPPQIAPVITPPPVTLG